MKVVCIETSKLGPYNVPPVYKDEIYTVVNISRKGGILENKHTGEKRELPSDFYELEERQKGDWYSSELFRALNDDNFVEHIIESVEIPVYEKV